MRIGIVGFGKMGMFHGALANAIDGVETIAICDKSRLTLLAFKSVLPKIKTFLSYEMMIEKCALDAVIITTPTFSHVKIARFASQKGVSVFIEKPLAKNYCEANPLKESLEKYGIKSFVGFCYRFYPTIAKGRELYHSGICGEVKSVKCEIYSGEVLKEHNGWRYDAALSGGGVLIDFGIHMLDLAVWYFGDVEKVMASTKKLFSRSVEDEAMAIIYFNNGLKINFETSWSRPQHRKATPIITINGLMASLVITDQKIDIQRDGKTETISFPDIYKGDYLDLGGINYTLQMKEFISLLQGGSTELTVAHGAYIQKVVDTIYVSAQDSSIQKVESGS